MNNKPEIREISLYVHIPFCKSKCNYCDFLSFGGCEYSKQKQYVSALCREIEAYRMVAKEYTVKTIFIGGGTPSYIDASLLEQVMRVIHRVFYVKQDAEITIEGNPDSLTRDKLAVYRKIGINRLSIGLQSTNDEMLQILGRVHNYDQFIAAYNSARQAGFNNINVDLMSGLPGESQESYIRTLAKVVELQPEHISAYSLTVEEGTPFSENETLLEGLPSEEEDRQQYLKTKMLLKNSGYNRYEISNYAKKGFECRHNIVYWTGGEYLGVGLGASSYLRVWFTDNHSETMRFHGIENFEEYIGRFSQCSGMMEDDYTNMFHTFENGNEDIYEMYENMNCLYGMNVDEGFEMDLSFSISAEEKHLKKYREYEESAFLEFIRDYYKDLYFSTHKDEMEEFMFLGLRMTKGISKAEFKKRFNVAIESIYNKVIVKYKEKKLLLEEDDRLYLSDAGIDVSNVIMAEFML